MDQNTFDFLILAIFIVVGIYSLYTVLRLKQRGRLFENKLLTPANMRADDCLDEAGYVSFISRHLTIFGILCLLMAAAEIVRIFVLDTQIMALNIILFVLEILVFVYLSRIYAIAAKRYWTMEEAEETPEASEEPKE